MGCIFAKSIGIQESEDAIHKQLHALTTTYAEPMVHRKLSHTNSNHAIQQRRGSYVPSPLSTNSNQKQNMAFQEKDMIRTIAQQKLSAKSKRSSLEQTIASRSHRASLDQPNRYRQISLNIDETVSVPTKFS